MHLSVGGMLVSGNNPLSEKSMNSHCHVSVVIPSYNSRHFLKNTIESLFNQKYPHQKYEIIIVDDCSTDGTEDIIRELQDRAPCRLVYYRNEKNLGPASSRNRGINMAQGNVIAFTDSDCIADSGWLQNGMKHFGDNISFVSGKVLPIPNQPIKFFTKWKGSVESEDTVYPTCNIFYSRKALLAVGGFNELFKAATCEDAELAWRVQRGEGKNVFAKDAMVYHEVVNITPWKWLTRKSNYYWLPLLFKCAPEKRAYLLNRVFPYPLWNYRLLLIAIILAIVFINPVYLLLSLPHAFAMCRTFRAELFSLRRMIHGLIKILFVSVRELIHYVSYIYGGIRHRNPVF